MIETFRNWREAVSRWAQRGHWLAVMVKTALTHGIVWELSLLAGTVLGLAAMWAGGVLPIWAAALPLLGYGLGARFYLDREFLGENADFDKGGWKARLDSFLDFVIPWLITSATLYGVLQFYGVAGF